MATILAFPQPETAEPEVVYEDETFRIQRRHGTGGYLFLVARGRLITGETHWHQMADFSHEDVGLWPRLCRRLLAQLEAR